MKAQKTVIVHGMAGYGKTVTEAKADAIRTLESAINADYTPAVFTKDGYGVFVYRSLFEWCSVFTHPDDTGVKIGPSASGEKSRDEAIKSGMLWIAQNIFREKDGNDDYCASIITDESTKDDFIRWAKWQHSYAAWRKTGASDIDAREYADGLKFPETA